MALDPSIALQTRGVVLPDPVAGAQNVLAIQGMQQRNALASATAQREAQQYADEQANQNALRGYYGSGQTDADVQAVGRVAPNAAASLIKSRLDADKAKADARKDNATASSTEQATKVAALTGFANLLRDVKDQAGYDRATSIGHALFGPAPVPAQYDPQTVQQMLNFTLSQKDSLDNQAAVARNTETARHNKSDEGLTARGQNMADARSREANAQGKVPSGYRQLPDGSLQFIPGGPADPAQQANKPLTETQGKATSFATRAQAAHDILSGLAAEGTDKPGMIKTIAEGVPVIGGALGAATNVTQSPKQQQVEQAQRDFVNAALRVESGAAISESEFENARKQYFPQRGDSSEVIAQKKRNRETEIAGLKVQAGPGMGRIQAPVAPSSGLPAGWTITPVTP